MGEVYKFSEYFEPSDLEVGPDGVDGELLVSENEAGLGSQVRIRTNTWVVQGGCRQGEGRPVLFSSSSYRSVGSS